MMSLDAFFNKAKELKAQSNFDAAIKTYQAAIAAYPNSANAEHNLASLYADMLEYEKAYEHINQVFSKGGSATVSLLLKAQIESGLLDLDKAICSYRHLLTVDPVHFDGHRELAQLCWMLHQNEEEATTTLRAAMQAHPNAPQLAFLYADIADYVGNPQAALERIEHVDQKWPDIFAIKVSAAYKALQAENASKALKFAQRAVQINQKDLNGWLVLASAWLANKEPTHAVTAALQARQLAPDHQEVLAVYALALRAQGNEDFNALYDFDNMVQGFQISVPDGWTDITHYLADLRDELKAAHPYETHPFGQSLRSGTQAANLLSIKTPAIQAFEQAIAPCINAYVDNIGQGDDPLRQRNTKAWKLSGMWSVWLRSGGFHQNHVHPHGWISSACYIELPEEVKHADNLDKSGWIQFGEPLLPKGDSFPPQHFVQPEEGKLVLFPSYMWHGTRTFTGTQPRLTIAFDIVPA